MTELLKEINIGNIQNDLSGNCELIKEIVVPSKDWYTPKLNDYVKVDYKIGKSDWMNYTGKFIKDNIFNELYQCILSMKLRETSKFFCKKSYFTDNEFSKFIVDDITVIDIKLNTIYKHTYLGNNTKLQRYLYKYNSNIVTPRAYDEVSIKYIDESIIDNKDCLDSCELVIERLNKLDLEDELKSAIINLKKDEICVIEFNEKKYTIHLIDWKSLYVINIEEDIYMKKTKQCVSVDRIGYEYFVKYKINDDIHEHVVGNGEISGQIEKCLFNMYKGEEAIIYEKDKTTTISLLDFKVSKDYLMDDKLTKYHGAVDRKNEGNELYKKELYDRAISKYTYGLELIKQLDSTIKTDETVKESVDETVAETESTAEQDTNSSEQVLDVKKLHVSLMMNICQCYIKLNDTTNFITLSKEILKIDPNNSKTLYRKGLVYLDRNDTDKAKIDLYKAYEIDPENKELKKAIIRLKEQLSKNKNNNKKIFGNILKNKTICDDVHKDKEEKTDEKTDEKQNNIDISEITKDENKEDNDDIDSTIFSDTESDHDNPPGIVESSI